MQKVGVVPPAPPRTPPPSTHRTDIPESPTTPTHPPLNDDGGASLFDDNGHIQPPLTPVLYNLIRNDGAQKFVAAAQPRHTDRIESTPFPLVTDVDDDEDGASSLRGHPSACLFVARYFSR